MPWEETEEFIRSGHRDPKEFESNSLRTIWISEKEGKSMSKLIIVMGMGVVSVLIILSFLGTLSWAVTGVLSTVVVGVVGWVLNYLSEIKEKRTETIGKTIQPKPLLEETFEIVGKEHTPYELYLDEGEEVKGEVSSNEAIILYFLTKYSFRRFEEDEDFSFEYGAEGILRQYISLLEELEHGIL